MKFLVLIGFLFAQLSFQFVQAAPKPDVTAPKVSSSILSGAYTNVNKLTISIVDDSAVVTQVVVSGTIVSTQTAKKFDVTLSEGINSFTIRSKDVVGNVAADFLVSNITLDTKAPVISTDVKSNASINTTIMRVSVVDGLSVNSKVTVNGQIRYYQTNDFDVILAQGSNSVTIQADDAAKNTSQLSITKVNVDSVAPKIISSVSSDAYTNVDKIKITVTDSNSTSTLIYKNGIVLRTDTTKAFDLILSQGRNDFKLVSKDSFGNTAEFELSNVTLDTSAPVISSSVIAGSVTKFNRVTISIADSSPSVTTTVTLNNKNLPVQQNKAFDVILAEGRNDITVSSKDAAGNQSAKFTLSNVVLDSVAPKISSTIQSNTSTKTNTVRITVTDSSTVTTKIYKSGTLQSTQTSKSFDLLLTEGMNDFKLVSTDAAQNSSDEFFLTNVELDTKAPVITSSITSNSTTNSMKAYFTVSDLSSVVTTQITLNGRVLIPQSGKTFELILSEGKNDISLISTDGAGNQSAKLSLTNVVLDSIAPTIKSYNHVVNSITNLNTVIIEVSDNRPTFYSEIYKNGMLFATKNTKTFEFVLSEGKNNFLIRTKDAAGNIAELDLSNIILDTKAPVISSSLSGGSYTNRNSVHISISDSANVTTDILKGGVVIRTENAKEFDISLVEGANSFTLRSRDQFGQAARDFNLFNIYLDTISPTITSNLKTNDVTNQILTIIINDASPVTTQIYKNGSRLADQTTKNLSIQLSQGINSFIIKTLDAAGNQSAELKLDNIVYDTTPPVITANVYSNATVESGKVIITVTDLIGAVTEVKRNDVQLPNQTSKSFELDVLPGFNTFRIKSTDALGNKSFEFLLSNVYYPKTDTIAPIISSNIQSGTVTKLNQLQISITEDSSLTTEIFKDGVLIDTKTSKDFFIALSEGVNNFLIKSSDSYNNKSELAVSQVISDTIAPRISSNVSAGTTVDVDKVVISVSDVNLVSTQIFKDGVLIKTEISASFELPLSIGLNSYTIKSKDAAANETVLELTNIEYKLRDTEVPQILALTYSSPMFTIRNSIPIIIRDASTVETKIYKDGNLVLTKNDTEFEIPLTEGLNNFKLVSTDSYGNSSTLNLNSISYASGVPTVLSPSDGTITAASVLIVYAAGAPYATVPMWLNISTYRVIQFDSTGSGSMFVDLEEGPNHLELKYLDNAGNYSPSTFLSVFRDSVLPNYTITADPQNPNHLSVSIDDATNVITTILRNDEYFATQTTKNFELNLDPGKAYILSFRDAASNVVETTVSGKRLDTAPPVIASSVSSGSIVSTNVIQITITDASNVSTEVYKDGSIIKAETNKTFEVTLAEGANNFLIKSTDAFGNKSDLTISNITLDTVAPIVSASVSSGAMVSSSKIHISISDATSITAQVFKDGNLFTTEQSKEFDLTLVAGKNSFVVKVLDAVNHLTELQIANVTYKELDTVGPQIIGFATFEGIFVTQANFPITIFDNSDVVTTITNNSLGTQNVVNTKEFFLPLVEGNNSFTLRSVDSSGNETIFEINNISLNTKLPDIGIANGRNGITFDPIARIFVFFSGTAYTGFSVTHNDLINYIGVMGTSNATAKVPLIEGMNTLDFRFSDVIGNISAPRRLNLILDSIAPQIISNLSSGAQSEDGLLKIKIVDASETGTALYNLDGSYIFGTDTNDKEITYQLKPGKNSLTVRSFDEVGNGSVLELTNIQVGPVDSAAPIISSSVQSGTITNNPIVQITVTDDSEQVSTDVYNNSNLLLTSNSKSFQIILSEGENNLILRSEDSSHNKAADFLLSNVILDRTSPIVSTDAPADGYLIKDRIHATITEQNFEYATLIHDGNVLMITDEKEFDIFFPEGPIEGEFDILAVDIAGNETIHHLSIYSRQIKDITPPYIFTNAYSGMETSNYNLSVNISDKSSVTTKVYLNGTLLKIESTKQFEVPLIVDFAPNNIVLESVDSYGNTADPYVLSDVWVYSGFPRIKTSLISNQITSQTSFFIDTRDNGNYAIIYSRFGGFAFGTLTLPLTEGSNTFSVEFWDQTYSPWFTNIYSNIIRDTIKPAIISDFEFKTNLDNSANVNYSPYTNKEKIKFIVQDAHPDFINVNFNGTTVIKSQSSTLDLMLTNGSYQNVTVTAIDKAGNSVTRVLGNIIVDRKNPAISTNLKDKYNFATVPQSETITIQSSELLKTISVNGTPLIPIGPTSYSYTTNFDSFGTKNFTIIAVDLAGNETVVQKSVDVELLIPADTQAPIITASVSSGALTRNSKVRISISDESQVRTYVYRNDILINDIVGKSFDIDLVEGGNNLKIRSNDQYGNLAPDFIISNITLDSVAPTISSNLKAEYMYETLPQIESFTINLSEPVQSISLNGQALVPVGPLTYSYTVQFDDYGQKQFNIIAVDAAGNESVLQQSTNVVSDYGAPIIATNNIPPFINTNSFQLIVSVTDDDLVSTEIFVDGISKQTTSLADFSYTVEFDPAQLKQIRVVKLISTDATSRKTTKILAITKDATPLAITIIAPSPNSILDSREVIVYAVANKALAAAKINNHIVPINSDGVVVKGLVEGSNGPATIEIEVTDISGATITSNVHVEIQTRAPAWDYKECPINQ